MSFRTALLPLVDRIRGGVPGRLDLRPRTVTVRVRTWTGARVGVGTKTDVDTVVRNAGYNPKVIEVTTKDIVASGGLYASGDFRIGPITPEYTGGGTPTTTTDPSTTTTGREIFYKIEGPGLPTNGAWFHRIDSSDIKNFRNEVVVRRTAVAP